MSLFWIASAVVAAGLWAAGLRHFVRAPMTTAWKLTWSGLLLVIGAAIGTILSIAQMRSRFLVVLAALPVIAAADVLLFRSKRGLGYWLQACGFEVVTVFTAAAIARYALDLLGVRAIAGR